MTIEVVAEPRLSRTDWQAVTVALHDAEQFGCAGARPEARRGVLSRLYSLLTGYEAPRPLADPRLDAVRRFVCAVRRQSARAMELVPELRAFGYSPAQIEALRIVAA